MGALALPLLVLRVPLADDAGHAAAAHHFAMLADDPDTRTDFQKPASNDQVLQSSLAI
jgi:hypothetical protein